MDTSIRNARDLRHVGGQTAGSALMGQTPALRQTQLALQNNFWRTPNRIIVSDTTGLVTTSDEIVWNSANGFVALGTAAAGVPASFAQHNAIYLASDNGNSPLFSAIAWSDNDACSPSQKGVRIRGTVAAPMPVLVDNILNKFRGAGQYDTTVGHLSNTVVEMILRADENWSATHQGTRIEWWATPTTGAIASVLVGTLKPGSMDIPTGSTYNINGTPHTHAGGLGDVVGPGSAINNNFAAFDTTTGKLIKDSGYAAGSFALVGHNHAGVYAPVSHGHTLAGADFVNQGTTTTVLHGNAAGNPSWGAVALADMATMATASLIYRRTAGTGIPEVNTLAQLKTDLGSMPPTAHAVLDSTYHTDVLTGSITRGDILYGNATPKIARLALGGVNGACLVRNATDVLWSSAALGGFAWVNDTSQIRDAVQLANTHDYSFPLIFQYTPTLPEANTRHLVFQVHNADRLINLSGDLVVELTSTLNQDLTTDADVTHRSLNVGSATGAGTGDVKASGAGVFTGAVSGASGAFANLLTGGIINLASGTCLLPAGPSTYDLFTATNPTGSNGLYMVILSQQGGTNNSQAIAYVVCYGAAAGAIVLQSQNSVTIGTNGAVVRAVAAAGFGATTMNWTAIRLR